MGTLVLILGDQLTPEISSLSAGDKTTDVVLMAEVMDEAIYVRHHKKKIAFVFSAMRHFAEELRESGWTVDYVTLDAEGNTHSLQGEVARALKRHSIDSGLRLTEAGEWRLQNTISSWQDELSCSVEILPDNRFIMTPGDFANWAEDRKVLRMEHFYREIRRKTGLLMEDDNPVGGKWNFDTENRKPASADLHMPELPRFEPDEITENVLNVVERRFNDHFGKLRPFWFAVTRSDAENALEHFIENRLSSFGDYQDAMLSGERFLYHSVLSHYLNCGLLDPLDICRRAEDAYRNGSAPINSVEGFIRQIIGWREYIRGVYWLKMPPYEHQNFFQAKRPLPAFYWTGDTDMHCLKEAIEQTEEEAYAHHIQRLMVTGNFAMLAGVNPHEVHEWYLSVYADAYEWVEMPNSLGMSQFADGGLVASKPYAASGAYINKMSDYCGSCIYDVKQKTGEKACPFNALYWDFLARNEQLLSHNRRLRNPYLIWRRMPEEKRRNYLNSAAAFLQNLI